MRALFLICAPMLCMGFTASAEANSRQADTKWGFSGGGGAAISPHYSGDDDYAISALPYARVSYSDLFYASVPEGANLKLYEGNGFRAVATAKFTFDREEDGSAPFRIAGKRTADLVGLGDVAASIELGGTLRYQKGNWSLSGSARQAVSGHEGLVGEIATRYSRSIRGYGPPIRLSIGPSLNFGDGNYMNAYYGVTPSQSQASGLETFSASGGLYSAGLSLSAMAPVTQRSALFLQASISQLTGDAKNAPLVRDRGDPAQAFGGLFWVYTFGQDASRGRPSGTKSAGRPSN